jgi:hypothetical protein
MTWMNSAKKLCGTTVCALLIGCNSLVVIGLSGYRCHAEEWSRPFKVGTSGPKAKDVHFEILKVEETEVLAIMENLSDEDYSTHGRIDTPTCYITEGIGEQEELVAWDWCGVGKVDMHLYAKGQKLIAIPRPKTQKGTRVYIRLENSESEEAAMLLVYQEPSEKTDSK